jgi:uncharacterized protein (DUF952 family)
MDDSIAYKLLERKEWDALRRDGTFLGSAADLSDGFVHLSAPDQVAETFARHFSGRKDLVWVALDLAALGDAVRWERSRDGALFPHLYAPLPFGAVVGAGPMVPGEGGTVHLEGK